MKTDLFQTCGHWWVFQIYLHIECSTFTASSFTIWNSSTGIPSPPLALLVVMFPKAHLSLHSRISGCSWVTTPSWLSGSWRSFLYSSSVYSCHLLFFVFFFFCPLFLISYASVRPVPLLSFIVPILAWNVPLVSLKFLITTLSHPIVFLYFFALTTEEGFLISPCCSLNSAFKWVYISFSPLPFTSLLFSAICEAPSDNHFAFWHFFFLRIA